MTRIRLAAEYAILHHDLINRQRYGPHPYSWHLGNVALVVQRYKALFDPAQYEALLCAAWLHDILEDCNEVSYGDVSRGFGPDVAEMVWAVTNPPKSPWRSAYIAVSAKLTQVPDALPLKLADRIANMEQVDKLGRYSRRFNTFYTYFSAVPHASRYQAMWDDLRVLAGGI